MRVSDFTYELPEERIALFPPKKRGASRLLVVNRATKQFIHKKYVDLADYLRPEDVLILNNTRVIKARLLATTPDNKQRELLLLEDHHVLEPYTRKVLYKGSLRAGEELKVAKTTVRVDKILDGGLAIISSTEPILDLTETAGSVPLPPYMHRTATKEDIERYQTIFAEKPGSVAAPTASLNFTDELEVKLKRNRVNIAYLTLHVGLGTFLPIRTDEIENHKMHSEYFEIPAETIEIIQTAKQNGKRIVALGTTIARTLEFCADQILLGALRLDAGQGTAEEAQRNVQIISTVSEHRRPVTQHSAKNSSRVVSSADKQAAVTQRSLTGEADIFIYPGYTFKLVDGLVTNFHAPKSTVLMLTAAFTGWDTLKPAYEEAIRKKYAFLSYGDSMLIV